MIALLKVFIFCYLEADQIFPCPLWVCLPTDSWSTPINLLAQIPVYIRKIKKSYNSWGLTAFIFMTSHRVYSLPFLFSGTASHLLLQQLFLFPNFCKECFFLPLVTRAVHRAKYRGEDHTTKQQPNTSMNLMWEESLKESCDSHCTILPTQLALQMNLIPLSHHRFPFT